MRLIDWMKKEGVNDDAMAVKLGLTAYGVRKIMYGERNPSAPIALRIEEITGGKVRLRDLVIEAA